MSQVFDVIVLGLGGMGSASAYQLAKRGKRVLGIEQFTAPHDKGSSHGKTRVIRQSYYEDPAYVPLLLRAYELWREIEHETNTSLLHEVGGLMIGRPESEVVTGSLRSAKQDGLKHELLDARDLRRRFPPLTPQPDEVALYEARAGYVRTEDAVQAHLDRAAQLGAILKFETPALGWEATSNGVRVRTANATYEAERLVITPGAWAPEILADLNLPLQVERQVLFWFDPIGGTTPFQADRFPIFIWETEDNASPYGFPSIDGPTGGVKIAYYRTPKVNSCTARAVDRGIHDDEIELMRRGIANRIPALKSRCLKAVTCLYTNTPDLNFAISLHPKHPQVALACGFSGHGFKFCSVVGEIMADLAMNGMTSHDIRLFNLNRLRAK